MKKKISLLAIVYSLVFFSTTASSAGFGINATRLIYPEKERSISVTVRNTQAIAPYLVQVKISGEQNSITDAPFTVTPPLFRLEPQSVNQLRIAFSGSAVKNDQESVFYLHATAIPASSSPTESKEFNGVQGNIRFGVGSIIKIFYRPNNIQGDPRSAQKDLKFETDNGKLKVINTSPYYISLANLVIGDEKMTLNTLDEMMLAPNGGHIWTTKKNVKPGMLVKWDTIDDTGGINAFSTKVL